MTAAVSKIAVMDDANQQKQIFFALLCLSIYMVLLSPVVAAVSPVNTPMGDVLCAIMDMVFGNLGRGLATLAIMTLGVGAMVGKVSWGLCITVAVGIAVIFNAPFIEFTLTGIQPC